MTKNFEELHDAMVAENARYKALASLIEANDALTDAEGYEANNSRLATVSVINGEVDDLVAKMKLVVSGRDPYNDNKTFEEVEDEWENASNTVSPDYEPQPVYDPQVIYEGDGTKASYWVDNTVSYLIGLVDNRGNWYTFDMNRGLVLATDDEIESIKFNAEDFEVVNDEVGNAYAAVMNDDGTAVEDKRLLILHNAKGVAYKFNKFYGLIELPKQSKPHDAFFNTDLKRV